METVIKSMASKYLVNISMIVVFGISVATAFIKPDRPERPHETGREQIKTEINIYQLTKIAEFSETENYRSFSRSSNEEKSNTHIYFGLFWIALMLIHIIHHWNWFKKLFFIKHILKNKLLVVTAIISTLMMVSGILLWTDIIPRGIINMKEIHEITGQLLIIFVLIHVVQRIKWYFKTTISFSKTIHLLF